MQPRAWSLKVSNSSVVSALFLTMHTAVAEQLAMRMCQHNYSFIEKNTYSSMFLRLDNAVRDRRNKLTCMLDSGQPFTAMNFAVFVCFMLFQTN